MLRWCFDIPGEFGLTAADITLDAARLAPAGLVAFGLGGPEIGVSRVQFRPHFAAARVLAVSWASRGDTSNETQPSTPRVRSQIGRNNPAARVMSSTVVASKPRVPNKSTAARNKRWRTSSLRRSRRLERRAGVAEDLLRMVRGRIIKRDGSLLILTNGQT